MTKAISLAAKSSTRRLESGRLGLQVAGAASVEIKATIEAKNLKAALKLFGLKDADAEERIVYFFDTPKLELFRSGVIVRARRVPGGSHDSTIKIRPVVPKDMAAKWQNNKGFKLEADAGEKGVVLSASLSRAVGKGVIKRVVAERSELGAVFDKDQELFLAEMCRIRYRLDKLEILGPIAALWWKVQHPGLPFPMTAELWTRGDRDMMLEVSIRVPVAQAAFANAGFMGFLTELGAKRDNALQTKTLWALDYYAKKIGPDSKVKTTPKTTTSAKQTAGKKAKTKPTASAAKSLVVANTGLPPKGAKPTATPSTQRAPDPEVRAPKAKSRPVVTAVKNAATTRSSAAETKPGSTPAAPAARPAGPGSQTES